jgi:hypothetical protein
VACHEGLNARGVRTEDDDACLDFEGFQRFQDPDDEREAEEIQQGFGGAHSSRPASRQDHAR